MLDPLLNRKSEHRVANIESLYQFHSRAVKTYKIILYLTSGQSRFSFKK